MLRTLRASRSLPSLRTAAAMGQQQAAVPAVPTMPLEYGASRTMATATKPLRTRKSALTLAQVDTTTTTPTTPKKRGRPRKDTLAAAPTTVQKRSSSTDAKSGSTSRKAQKKEDHVVPAIPQPSTTQTQTTSNKSTPSQTTTTTTTKKTESDVQVPSAADSFRASQEPPRAQDAHSTISTSDPADLGTRVQAVSRKSAGAAEKFAQEAVSALESTGESVSRVQDLLKQTLDGSAQGNNESSSSSSRGQGSKRQESYTHESSGEDIPQGEKNVLLSMLGLTGLWVAFGGKLQKKNKK